MTTLTLAAVWLLGGAALEVEQHPYFPLNPGDRWVYEEEERGRREFYTDIVREPVMIGERTAFPIETMANGQSMGKVFYSVENGEVLIVAFDESLPIERPYAILKNSGDWRYFGETQFINDLAPLTLTGRARAGRERRVNERSVSTIEVTLDATVGEGRLAIKNRQTAIYGRGVGLVEMREETDVDGSRRTRTRRLVEYEPANPR